MYKATIVIPNINGKGWLKDSIESVYAQTEQNFQLIVVDNGSTDESLEQARSYCSRANFTLIENGTNTGFSHAVNQPARPATAAVSATTPNKSVSSRPAAGLRCTASAFWTRSAPLTKTSLPTLRMWT